MKAVLILVLGVCYFQASLVATRSIDHDEDELEPQELECITELQLNKQNIITINKEEISPENNDEFNSFLHCYYQKKGYQNTDGDIDYIKLETGLRELAVEAVKDEPKQVQQIVRQVVRAAVSLCNTQPPLKGKTPGQTAVKVQNCIIKKMTDYVENN